MSTGGFNAQLIESLPLAVLETTPAGEPPKGIQANFTNPPSLASAVIDVGTAVLVLALICFSIRIYTKLAISRKWQWDDLTCSLGFMCAIVYFGTLVNGCANSATGKHLYDLYLIKALNKPTLIQDYVTVIMGTPALGLIKFSLFFQYYLLFKPLRWVRISVWIGATISGTFYVIVTICAFILNSPWPGEGLLGAILSWHYQKFANFSIPTGIIGLLVDWYLLILPIPAVLGLQMSMAKKLGVLVIFATGGLAAVSSVVTLYYRVRLQEHGGDATWDVSFVHIFTQIEMFAGVTASSMPTVSKFFTRQLRTIISWGLTFKSNIMHLMSGSAREKLPSDNPKSKKRSGKHNPAFEENKGFRMRDLESSGSEPKRIKSPWAQDSQTNLTQEISIT